MHSQVDTHQRETLSSILALIGAKRALDYSGLHLNENQAGKDARAPSMGYADYSYLRAYENRCNSIACKKHDVKYYN